MDFPGHSLIPYPPMLLPLPPDVHSMFVFEQPDCKRSHWVKFSPTKQVTLVPDLHKVSSNDLLSAVFSAPEAIVASLCRVAIPSLPSSNPHVNNHL